MAQGNVLVALGKLTLIDRNLTPAAPVQIAQMKDINVTNDKTNKLIMADKKFPIAAAEVGQKIGLKAKCLDIDGYLISKLMGGTQATGGTTVYEQTSTIPSTPFQVTVTNSGTFTKELEVRNASTGQRFKPVASGPVAGQYSAAAGVYTFASADNVSGISVTIRYAATTTPGTTTPVSNGYNAAATTYEAVIYNQYTAQDGTVSQLGFCFYSLIVDKWSLAYKSDDATELDVEFTAIPRSSDEKIWDNYSNTVLG